MEVSDFNITIVGFGLIGGSYGMALKKLKPKNLWAVDIDKKILDKGENLKIIDKGYLNPEKPLKNSDLVIICLYPKDTLNFIKSNIKNFKNKAIITDVSGIKANLVKEINLILRDDLDFIGGHPMAGREFKGFDYASKDLFNGANYIMTPSNKNKSKNIKIIEDIIKAMGFKNIVKITPERHDEIIALTSQLPHILSVAMVNGCKVKNIDSFIGGSFKDIIRVANINSKLWTELLINNNENIIEKLNIFKENILKIENIIKNNNEKALNKLFENTRKKMEENIK
ncbi:MAG: prephenate dehydrogenase [Firmicutes bacterium]|nr:prephenate dehydrogenase [Bacillota bacterium]